MDAPEIAIKVQHGKTVHEVKIPASATVGELKAKLCEITRVPVDGQKLMKTGVRMTNIRDLPCVRVWLCFALSFSAFPVWSFLSGSPRINLMCGFFFPQAKPFELTVQHCPR